MYEIERSTDGINFRYIASVTSGPANNNEYYYEDNVPGAALYYRIKVISVSGNSFESNIVLLKTLPAGLRDVQLLQNPVTGNTMHLRATVQEQGTLSFAVNDLAGHSMMLQTVTVNAGVNEINIPVPVNCTRGIYVLRAEGLGIRKSIRVMFIK